MGIWRTGADELCYDAHEDDEYLMQVVIITYSHALIQAYLSLL